MDWWGPGKSGSCVQSKNFTMHLRVLATMNSSRWYQTLHVSKSSFAIIVFSIYYKYSILKPSDKITYPAYIVAIFSAFWYITFTTLNGLLSGPQKIVNEPPSWILPYNHCAPLMQNLASSWFVVLILIEGSVKSQCLICFVSESACHPATKKISVLFR